MHPRALLNGGVLRSKAAQLSGWLFVVSVVVCGLWLVCLLSAPLLEKRQLSPLANPWHCTFTPPLRELRLKRERTSGACLLFCFVCFVVVVVVLVGWSVLVRLLFQLGFGLQSPCRVVSLTG